MTHGNYAFLAAIPNRALRSEVRQVLVALELISEAGTIAIGKSSTSSDRPLGPPGFAGIAASQCPPIERSAWEHYRWRFEEAVREAWAERDVWRLLFEAEREADQRRYHDEADVARRTALEPHRHEVTEPQIREAVLEREGMDSAKVSTDLKLPAGYIEKVRAEAGRDPDFGRPRPDWHSLTPEQKRQVVHTLAEQGETQKITSRRLGVSLRTVKSYWPRTPAR